MMALPLYKTALWAAALLLSTKEAVATPAQRHAAAPGYSSSTGACPERCSVSGPNTGNWSVYPDFRQIKRCEETMFYDFSLYDPVDDKGLSHRIHACSSFGPDFSLMPASTVRTTSTASINVEFELGWWNEGYGLASSGIRSLAKQLRKYVGNGHGDVHDKPFIIYGQSGQATLGLYIGKGLLGQSLAESALKVFQDNLESLNVSAASLAMQLCEPEYDSSHIFGVMVTSNGTFGSIQSAIKSWANATCLSFAGSKNFSGVAKFSTSPLASSSAINSTVARGNLRGRADGECRTYQVQADDNCDSLGAKFGLSRDDLEDFNKNT
ncbi:hypothetical protein BDV12DRAFT_200571 [Aspergillus spectabilis]